MKAKQRMIILVCMAAILLVIVSGFFSSCNKEKILHEKKVQHEKNEDCSCGPGFPIGCTPYIKGKNYFVKNTFENTELTTLKIENQEEFDRVFGPATYGLSGNDEGIPTSIDFNTQCVIAVIDVITDSDESLQPMYLLQENDKYVLHINKTTGNQMTYSIHNHVMIIVDKQYNGDIETLIH